MRARPPEIRRIAALCAALLAILLLGACGDDSDEATTTAPPPTSGGEPSAFQKHVQGFGRAAEGEERREIERLVTGFYDAHVDADGAAACALLTRSAKRAVTESFPVAKGEERTCANAFTQQLRRSPQRVRELAATFELTGARVDEDEGFALIRSEITLPAELPLRREGGAWKLDSISSQPLNPNA